MSEQPEEELPPSVGRMSTAVAVALARMDEKLTQALRSDSEIARRLAEHDALHAATAATLARLQAQQEAQQEAQHARDAMSNRPGVDWTKWVQVAIAALLALYVVLDHYGPPGS